MNIQKTPEEQSNNVIEIKGLYKYFGDYPASNNITLTIPKGKIYGFLGPNGAGKTTLIRIITNIYMPDEGEVKILGTDNGSLTQNKIAYLPEERGLYKKIKVLDQLVYFGQLKGLSKSQSRSKALEWLAKLGANEWANKKVQDLSKGMAQKVQFIATILHDPELLILDEPFSGFDPINAELLKNIILDFKKAGKTIILSTHVMHQVEQLCDEICLINKGKVILHGNIREIKNQFGRDTLLLEFDGDIKNIESYFGTENIVNFTDTTAEIKVNDDFNAEEFLNFTSSKIKLFRFQLVEPSIHDIFIKSVEGDK